MKKRLMVVYTSITGLKTDAERKTHLESVRAEVVERLKLLGVDARYHVLVVPDTIKIETHE